MVFFDHVLTLEELKMSYRRLVMAYHPDRGGDTEMMKKLNYEYAVRLRKLKASPRRLEDVCVGHIVMVNKSKCIVTEVMPDHFKARSLTTHRETYFSKSTGYAMLNFKFRARTL